LQPEARLREDVAGEGEVGVDAEGGLVLRAVLDGAGVPVGGFGFGCDGDVLDVLAEEGGALVGERRGVRKDDGDGEVEEAEGGEGFRAVVAPAGVRGDDAGVGFEGEGDDGGYFGGVGGVERVVGDAHLGGG